MVGGDVLVLPLDLLGAEKLLSCVLAVRVSLAARGENDREPQSPTCSWQVNGGVRE